MTGAADDRAALLESALGRALHFFTGAEGRWEALRGSGADDEELLERLGFEFGLSGGMVMAGRPDRFEIKGGEAPAFFWRDYRQGAGWTAVLRGAALAREARRLLRIPHAGGGVQERLF